MEPKELDEDLHDVACLARLIGSEGLARSVWRRFGDLASLGEAGCEALARIPGVGSRRARTVFAGFELARRIAAAAVRPGRALRSSGDVARWIREASRGDAREGFWSVVVDARHRVIVGEQVSLGTLQEAPVHPREVFRTAVRVGAAAVVVGHNHPSGEAEPSAVDHAVTDRLTDAGRLIGIELLDHVVVGGAAYYSFAEGRVWQLPPLVSAGVTP